MEQRFWKLRPRRLGTALAFVGCALMTLAAFAPGASAHQTGNVFQGRCTGSATSGACVLDEPEGNNPATNGTASYVRVGDLMTFVIEPTRNISEVQICMQATAPFDSGANVCAGIHGSHVAYTSNDNVYFVDLNAAGLASADPLYWTLHVVAGGATLQVLSPAAQAPRSTTTTTAAQKTTTTTTARKTTTTTTARKTTTTTTAQKTTTTTAAPTTTTTTTDPGTTTTLVPETTTTSSTLPAVTTTTAPVLPTTTTLPTQVLGKTLSRTGGIDWWVLIVGAVLLFAGACMLLSTRVVQGVKSAG